MYDTKAEMIEALVFKIKRLERVVDAVKDIQRDGVLGRGRERGGAQSVEISHERWMALLEAMADFS